MGRKLRLRTHAILHRRIIDWQGLAHFENPETHNKLRMASHALHTGPTGTLLHYANVAKGTITLLSFTSVLIFISPLLAFILLIPTLPELFISLKIGHQRLSLMYETTPQEREADYFRMVISSLRFAKEVRLFNLGDYFLDRSLSIISRVNTFRRKQQIDEIKLQIGLALFEALMSGIAFILVIISAIEGRITIGDVAFYITAFASIRSALSNIIISLTSLKESTLFFEHYDSVMSMKPSLFVSEHPQGVPPLQGPGLTNVQQAPTRLT